LSSTLSLMEDLTDQSKATAAVDDKPRETETAKIVLLTVRCPRPKL
jgi:hypothetical protein